MWNEEYYNKLLNGITQLLRDEQADVIKIICARIKAVGELNPTSRKQVKNLRKWQNTDLREIKKTIAKHTELAESEIDGIFSDAAQKSQEFADELAQAAAGVSYQGNVEALALATAKRCKDLVINMADTYAFKTSFGVLPIRQTYIYSINKAVSAISTGTLDYRTAMRQTIKELAESGLRNVYKDGEVIENKVRWLDESGKPYYSRRVDSSARMNILEGVRQVNQEVLNDAGEKFATGYEISAHDRPAPDHAAIQGMQFTRSDYEQLNATLARPIGTLNCMHIAFPIIYGVSKPTYAAEQLEQYRENASRLYEFDGKQYSGYECTQKQREMETAIRRHRDIRDAAKAAGDEILYTREKTAAVQALKRYKHFSDAVGLPAYMQRL